MSKLSNKKVSAKAALALTAASIVLLLLVNGRWLGNARLLEISGGAGILDLEMGYSPGRAYGMLTAYGSAGRAFYLRRIIPLDMLFGVVYFLCFTCLTRLFLQKKAPRPSHRAFYALPALTLLFDYAENLLAAVMLWKYSQQLTALCRIASCMTVVKYVFTVGSIAAILGLWLAGILARRKH